MVFDGDESEWHPRKGKGGDMAVRGPHDDIVRHSTIHPLWLVAARFVA
jgi:hypothetical protein